MGLFYCFDTLFDLLGNFDDWLSLDGNAINSLESLDESLIDISCFSSAEELEIF